MYAEYFTVACAAKIICNINNINFKSKLYYVFGVSNKFKVFICARMKF